MAEAGFCDNSGFSGWRCDGQTSKYCSCRTKIKSKSSKFSLKRSCDKTQESYCSYGCSYASGRCSFPPTPKPAHKACAKQSITDAKYTNVCPVLAPPYLLWQNVAESTQLMDAYLRRAAEDAQWWKSLRTEMVFLNTTDDEDSVTFNITNFQDLVKHVPEVITAWQNSQCENSLIDYSCRWAFPQCKGDSGFAPDCVRSCKKLDRCVEVAYQACLSAAKRFPPGTIGCNQYVDLFPDNVQPDGLRKCDLFCVENQNDYVLGYSGASPTSMPSSLFGLFISTLLLLGVW
eukprot:CAMPEP_0175130774 /NCGR_PEP_ID=MMETSP0087-20121206/6182_1 /TAXON_ID=136419 /ORGANISM="Unknown Unknown, Strain D1" /LENGTH=287 /DNA_ID=CAMNT_0016413007 /DNA_START=81 /DNA_END=944 /DNA_ORIENTATION=+